VICYVIAPDIDDVDPGGRAWHRLHDMRPRAIGDDEDVQVRERVGEALNHGSREEDFVTFSAKVAMLQHTHRMQPDGA
jgi:hypothetical protein